jgi:hypothetical protein
MSDQNKLGNQLKFRMQIVSFILVVISSIGAYQGVNSGVDWLTWTFLGLIAIGLAIAAWAS